jgi:hypothetical protein
VNGTPAEWLRQQVEADLAAARIISDGGFAAERWDTEPPGQVNPPRTGASAGINAALGLDPEDFPCGMPGWVQLAAWERLVGERPEDAVREGSCPVVLVDSGRREFEHVIRHDPQNAAADCEAKLSILDELAAAKARRDAERDDYGRWVSGDVQDRRPQFPGPPSEVIAGLECAVRLLASGYRHRDGYAEHWGDAGIIGA